MTRINVVPPHVLSDKHLGAEYRELPRLCGLVRGAIVRGETAESIRAIAPTEYTLGRGHCLFFYTRLSWVQYRYSLLVGECRSRGRKVAYPELDFRGIGMSWFGYWEVTEEAVRLNTERIHARTKLPT